MTDRLAADAVLLLHLGFILFAVFGGALSWRWPRAALLHLPALAWGCYVELSHRICPLTPLENHFRLRAGEQGYGGGFIEHYLIRLIYPPGLRADEQLVLAGVLVLVNLALYARALQLHRRRAA